MQADIAKEESLAKGCAAMSKITKGQQKEAAQAQLDGSQKMVKILSLLFRRKTEEEKEKRHPTLLTFSLFPPPSL